MNALQATVAALRAYRATGNGFAIIRRYHPAFRTHFDVVPVDDRYRTLTNFDSIYRIIGG